MIIYVKKIKRHWRSIVKSIARSKIYILLWINVCYLTNVVWQPHLRHIAFASRQRERSMALFTDLIIFCKQLLSFYVHAILLLDLRNSKDNSLPVIFNIKIWIDNIYQLTRSIFLIFAQPEIDIWCQTMILFIDN